MFNKIGKVILKEVINKSLPIQIPRRTPNPLRDLYDSPHRRKETIFDILTKENVEPGVGALIYCELFKMEHSGIYLGNNRIAQLSGKGNIEVVSPKGFTDNFTTSDKDIFIPVDSDGDPITCYIAAQNAEKVIGNQRAYNILLDNCHQFSSGCITGDFENNDNFLMFTKDTFKTNVSGKVKWQRWKWYK